jgi:aminoglycoside phosphotransferase (APT) family kinase protein
VTRARAKACLRRKETTMAIEFPRTLEDLTPEWLSTVLGRTVTGYDTAFLEGGALSDAFQLSAITYADEADGAPSSVVVKLAHRVKALRDFALMGHAYHKELNFFQSLARAVPIHAPQVYGCFADGSLGSEYFIIVMEDLTAHSKAFDQIHDPPNEAFARKIALEAAKLHAAFWESETTRLPWVGRADGRYVFALDAMSKMGHATWGPFRALYEQVYGRDLFAGGAFQAVEDLTELLCGPQGAAIHETIYDLLSARPKTLLHGDMRADNVFRTDPALGKSVEESTLTFIDWQILHAGPPGPEFTQAWMHSLEPEVRRHERSMLKQYHDRLVALNPAAAAYTYDMLLEDYALGCCFWWTALISIGAGTFPTFDRPENARAKRLWGTGLSRSISALRDLDCLARVRQVAADVLAAPRAEGLEESGVARGPREPRSDVTRPA